MQMNYHIAIDILAAVICVLYIINSYTNRTVPSHIKLTISLSFLCLIILLGLDVWIVDFSSDASLSLLKLLYAAKYALIPFPTIFCIRAVKKSRFNYFAYASAVLNLLFALSSYFLEFYFEIDSTGNYSFGVLFPLFCLFELFVLASFAFVLLEDQRFKKSSNFVPAVIILVLGVLIVLSRIFFSELKITMLTMVFAYSFGYCFFYSFHSVLADIKEKEAAAATLKAELLETSNEELLAALERVYISIYEADLTTGKIKTIAQPDFMNSFISADASFEDALSAWCSVIVAEPSQADAREFFEISTIQERMRLVNSISVDLYMSYTGWERETLAVISRDKTGIITKMLILCQEINGPKEKELEKNEELKVKSLNAQTESHFKSEFLSNMSHDIRTPMNAIIGFAGIAQKSLDNKDRVSDCLDKILISGQHLNDLINDILDMSHIESGSVTIRETRNRITDIMNNILPIIQSQVAEKKMHFSLDTSGIESDYVYVDSIKLRRILVNVLGNALKFTPEKGVISVTVSQYTSSTPKTAGYRFIIKDNGIGMSQEFINRIYASHENDDSSSDSISGTGLSLSITKKMIDLMGGTISVESIVGKGTTFTIELELRLQEFLVDEETTNAPITSEKLFKGKRILVVEDNELNKEIALEILADAGFEAESVSNGLEAIDKLVTSPVNYYSVVLMDVQMPVMDGYKATNTIRHMSRKDIATIPIIAMTANAFEEDKLHAIASGMNDHISKPIDIKKLKSAIINQL